MAGSDLPAASFAQSRLNTDLKTALEIIEQFEKHRAWEYSPHKTRDNFYRFWLNIDPENIPNIVEGYKVLVAQGLTPTHWRQAVDAAPAIKKVGAQPGNKNRRRVYNDCPPDQAIVRQLKGNKYLIARLKRDHPDIAQRLADGEFRSVRAAAQAAGFKPPKKI